MLQFLILSAISTTVRCSTDPVHYPILHHTDDNVLQLFYDLCTSGKVPQAGLMSRSDYSSHKTMIMCKQGQFEMQHHTPEQIFVESTPINYKHNVIVNTEQAKGNRSRTTVYVVPPKVTHQYDVKVKPGEEQNSLHDKPIVYFLSRPANKTEKLIKNITSTPFDSFVNRDVEYEEEQSNEAINSVALKTQNIINSTLFQPHVQ